MERKKLKKFKMAVGICGPTVLYTNIYKAYTVEEAVQMYDDEYGLTPSKEEYELSLQRMREVEEEKPLEKHFDSRLEELKIGDRVLAIAKSSGSRSVIVDGIISDLTKRGVKIKSEEKEYLIRIGKDDYAEIEDIKVPFFSKLVRVNNTLLLDELKVGDAVAFMTSAYASNNYYFSFGTVSEIKSSYTLIDTDNGQVKKNKDKIRKYL